MSNVLNLRPMGVLEAEAKPELTEEEFRTRFEIKRRPWDPQWGGRCPYEDIPAPGYKDRAKPSLIDKLMPYILIIGFIGLCYFCVWIGYILMGVAD